MEYTLEQKFKALCQITRATHFEWRETFVKMYPDRDPLEAILIYWEIVGHDTAKAYLKAIDREKPVVPQLVKMLVDSSLAMGENAKMEKGEGDEAYQDHQGCPWVEWHEKHNALREDQPGCDCWISTIIKDFNKELGTKIEFETLCSIPEGDESCKRIITENSGS